MLKSFALMSFLVGILAFPTRSLGIQHWVSIAFDKSSGAIGVGVGKTQRAASDMAIKDIPSRYWDDPGLCDRCIALATTPVRAYTIEVGYSMRCGDTERSAAADAQSDCNRWLRGETCRVRKIVCVEY